MLREIVKKIENCRVCKKTNFTKVFDFGPTPPANAFLKKEQLDRGELYFPLEVYFCNNCSFLTLGHVVSQKLLFSNYVYVSSTSQVFVKHFEDFANSISSRFKLSNDSLIIDIGSNDGILLKPFKRIGSRVLGIEPAKHIAQLARKDGIPTIAEFFSESLAKKIAKESGKAKIVTATNVFAHIDDLDEVVLGVKTLLADDGVFIIEVAYLVDFLKKRYFDLVYHEHLYYWAVNPFIQFFKRFDMEVFDVEKVASHGGSIRVFVKMHGAKHKIDKRVKEFIELEKRKKLSEVSTYREFAKKIEGNKIALSRILRKLKKEHKSIAGYGASAKSTTFLHYFNIGRETIDFIVDDSQFKQGLFTPGKHIPVVPPSEIYSKKPDYLLILAWNFADSIMKMHKDYKNTGGRFIIPVPRPKIA